MKTITNFSISRTHCGLTNYLLITQSKIVKFDYKNAVKYCPVANTMEVLPAYAVQDIKDNSENAEQNLFDYLDKEIFTHTNPAVKGYVYFRIVLSDGKDIICNSYRDFLEQYKK